MGFPQGISLGKNRPWNSLFILSIKRVLQYRKQFAKPDFSLVSSGRGTCGTNFSVPESVLVGYIIIMNAIPATPSLESLRARI